MNTLHGGGIELNTYRYTGRGSQHPSQPNSGGWLSSGGPVGAQGFRQGLQGGARSNSTAGAGGFGGGSGGKDEYGSGGGGFTGAYGKDDTSQTGHGSSFVNDNNEGNVSVALAPYDYVNEYTILTPYIDPHDYTSDNQYQGWVKIEFIGS